MKKYLIIAAALFVSAAFGQEYKVSKSTGKLVINGVNRVEIEGYSGSEIIFSSLDRSSDRDDRAKGLKAINSMGLDDNTGFGLSVVEKGDVVEVYQLKKMDGPRVSIKVPKGVKIVYSHSSPYGSDLKVRNVEGEIEVSTVHNGVHLDNVTGPMNIKTVHGEIEARFSVGIKSPIAIKSTHGPVDITLPATTKATLDLSTKYGEVFVDPTLKVEVKTDGDWKVYGAHDIQGTLNGGGIKMELGSVHNSVYLRKG